MSTETPDNIDVGRGLVLFDGACDVCRGGASRFGGIWARRGFRLLSLHDERAREACGVPREELMSEMHVVTPERRVLRGIDAALFLTDALPLGRPIRWVSRLPGVMPVARRAYRAFARRRYRISRAARTCDVASLNQPQRTDVLARFTPPLLWLALALVAGAYVTPWVWMSALAGALYAGCKWITWWPYRSRASRGRSIGYLVGYFGMDATSFLTAPAPPPPRAREYSGPLVKAAVGATLTWLVARQFSASHPLVAAWIGMIGLILMLHFGVLSLAAVLWRRAGVAAEPLMRRPTRATSLADFWGRRWNTGFRSLSHAFVFAPLATRLGTTQATFVVFLASGLIHDLVITLPAGAAYGRPTLYFLIQFAGILLERTRCARRLGLARGFRGWLYAAAFLLVPLPLLFPPVFALDVIVPLLRAIGGLP